MRVPAGVGERPCHAGKDLDQTDSPILGTIPGATGIKDAPINAFGGQRGHLATLIRQPLCAGIAIDEPKASRLLIVARTRPVIEPPGLGCDHVSASIAAEQAK